MKLLLASVLLGFTMPAVLGAQERQSPEETLKLCQAEVAARPNSAEAYYALGRAYLRFLSRKEANTEAISAFNSAIKLRPDYAEAYCGLGDAYEHSGALGNAEDRWTKAIEAYNAAMALSGGRSAEAYSGLAAVYFNKGDYEKAEGFYRAIVQMRPGDRSAQLLHVVVLESLHRDQEAIEIFRQLLLDDPDVGTFTRLMVFATDKPRRLRALEISKEVALKYPNNFNALANVGYLHQALDQNAEAINDFREALRVNSEDENVHYSLGLSYLAIGNNDLALREYRILLDIETRNPRNSGVAERLRNRIQE